jgi:glyoxalase-like protein
MKSFVGVHLCCFGTPDPAAERARLAAHGFEPEPLVHLERNLQDGTPVKFNVVYAPPAKMPEGRIQYVEHLTETNLWRKEWLNPLRLDAVFVVAADAAETAARWGRFTGVMPRRDGEFVELPLARGKVVIGPRAAMARLLGDAPPPPALAGYALSSGKPGEKPRAVKLPGALGGAWLMG